MNTKPVMIDVREPFEFDAGHVDGAINIPPAQLMGNPQALQDISKDANIIVYCRSGSRSNSAMHILRAMGYTQLTNGINQDRVTKLLAD